ncbi:hypothetical protein Aph02nite_13780 [Actinoplanes philippinensis]|uniref:Uncharacterized protein n=1 Tax=Actinoplanes philippinensis TaxID=35752 RepID=A0A1I1ZKA8_9ACTN|nr:hypothetical protein [Actinoplanes philippinensis]GIE75428.1 hypothetical protein Aph02nite_13780 [Actinoplanes philippinensis]SFE32264.1 hypothetical protein SAMN05421541_101159 [Actinoplanes philippinensis]
MKVNAASPFSYDSSTAYSRLQSARARLTTDQMPCAATPAVITADRAAIVRAEAEVARIEAAHAAEVADFGRSGRFLDVFA